MRIKGILDNKIVEKYGEKCYFCSENKATIIHFVDGNRSNTRLSNKRPACSDCFSSIHDSSEELIEWSLKLENPCVNIVPEEEILKLLSKSEFQGSTVRELSEISDIPKNVLNYSLENAEGIKSQDVSSDNRVWYAIDSKDENSKPNETIILFPDRREVAVKDSDTETMEKLGRVGHLVDMTKSGSLYRFEKEDVWNSPHDKFEYYLEELESVIGRIPPRLKERLESDWEKASQFTLHTSPEGFSYLEAASEEIFENVAKQKLKFNTHYTEFLSRKSMRITNNKEGSVKQTMYKEGYPVQDYREIEAGDNLDIKLQDNLELRDYQQEWVNRFMERKSGTFVGPSGSGKTIGSIGVMEEMQGETLIIVPKRELAQQWEDELIQKTTLTSSQIGQYHGGEKTIAPVTIATYDTARASRHRKLFNKRNWGLLILDECHHCVAPVWKRVANIQSTARLGLTATPVRETGSAKDIYSLIGPPVGTDWQALFKNGYVQKPTVKIINIPWNTSKTREKYNRASGHSKRQIASTNPQKTQKIATLLNKHKNKNIVIFVEWIKQGKLYSENFDVPFICGETPHKIREEYFESMRTGENKVLIISRVGDEGIDIPNADVCIIASTLGSSNAQTAQRIGRTMRPTGASKGYLLATRGSNEEDFIRSSTQYLAEQGIKVEIDT